MTEIYLIRHGQASFLAENYDKLSPIGEEQARLLGDYFGKKNLTFDRIVSGPHQRQIRTTELVAEVMRSSGMPWEDHTVANEFAEIESKKILEGALTHVDDNHYIKTIFREFQDAENRQAKGTAMSKLMSVSLSMWFRGEFDVENHPDWQTFSSRIRSAVEVLARTHAGRKLAIFTSGGPIGAMLENALAIRPGKTMEMVWDMYNSSFHRLKVRKVDGQVRFFLTSFNEIPHLPETHVTFV